MTTATAPRPTPRASADPAGVRKALAREEGGRKWLVRLAMLLALAGAVFAVVRWRQRNLFFGGVSAVEIRDDGSLAGAGDPRRGGAAVVVDA